MSLDQKYMRHALALAQTGVGRTGRNPSVGCVLVKGSHVIAAARTGDGGRPHAEFLALEMAGYEAKGATAYVTLEPCAHEGETPSCALMLVKAGLQRVLVGVSDPDPRTAGAGIDILEHAKVSVEVVSGVLEAEVRNVHSGFFMRIVEKRPFVTLKIATSVDGKIAGAVGQRTQISGTLAQRYVHLERSQHDAILVGIGTALSDDPLLNCRLEGVDHTMFRVVLDRDLRLPVGSKLVQNCGDGSLIVLHSANQSDERAFRSLGELEAAGANLVRVDTRDIRSVLGVLAEKGVNRLLVEGGAAIHHSFLGAGFCDRFLHLRSKALQIGEQGVEGPRVAELETLYGLKYKESRDLDEDVLEVYARCLQD